jgi:hypothetical protein
MRRQRHAKIVATVGPASASPDKLRELFLAVLLQTLSHDEEGTGASSYAYEASR